MVVNNFFTYINMKNTKQIITFTSLLLAVLILTGCNTNTVPAGTDQDNTSQEVATNGETSNTEGEEDKTFPVVSVSEELLGEISEILDNDDTTTGKEEALKTIGTIFTESMEDGEVELGLESPSMMMGILFIPKGKTMKDVDVEPIVIDRELITKLEDKQEIVSSNLFPVSPDHENLYFFSTNRIISLESTEEKYLAGLIYLYDAEAKTAQAFYRHIYKFEPSRMRPTDKNNLWHLAGIDGSKLLLYMNVPATQNPTEELFCTQEWLLPIASLDITDLEGELMVYTVPEALKEEAIAKQQECQNGIPTVLYDSENNPVKTITKEDAVVDEEAENNEIEVVVEETTEPDTDSIDEAGTEVSTEE